MGRSLFRGTDPMGTSQTIPKSTRVHPFWHTSTSKSHPMASLTGPVHGTSRLRRHHSPKPSSRCSTSERPQANPLKYVDTMGRWLIPLKANQKELLSSLNLPSPDGVHGYLMFLYNQCVVVLDSLFPWETGNKKKKQQTKHQCLWVGCWLPRNSCLESPRPGLCTKAQPLQTRWQNAQTTHAPCP